jgi:hypothetical protein
MRGSSKRDRWARGASTALVALGLCAGVAQAAEPFARGNVSGSLYISSGQALGNTYTTLGAGLGYMVADGLMLGFNGEAWFGNDPDIYKLTPEVRYTFAQMERFKPYVGAFATRTFYDGYEDLNSYGARAGVYIPFGGNAAASFGVVYEKASGCDEAVYRECDQVYPEAGLLFSF